MIPKVHIQKNVGKRLVDLNMQLRHNMLKDLKISQDSDQIRDTCFKYYDMSNMAKTIGNGA